VAHAVAEFILTRADAARHWNSTSNYVIALAAPRETIETFRDSEHDTVAFHEPDFDDAVTAVAFTPAHGVSGLLAGLPLAGR
jgi:hypothetical protein